MPWNLNYTLKELADIFQIPPEVIIRWLNDIGRKTTAPFTMNDVAAILTNILTIRERDGWDPVTDRPWREKAVNSKWQNK